MTDASYYPSHANLEDAVDLKIDQLQTENAQLLEAIGALVRSTNAEMDKLRAENVELKVAARLDEADIRHLHGQLQAVGALWHEAEIKLKTMAEAR